MAALQSCNVRMLRDIPVSRRHHSDLRAMTSSQGGSPLSSPTGQQRTRANTDSGSAFRIMGSSGYPPLLGRCPWHAVLLRDRERQEGSGSHQGESGKQGGKGQDSHRR